MRTERKTLKEFSCHRCGVWVTKGERYVENKVFAGVPRKREKLCGDCGGLHLIAPAWRKASEVHQCSVCGCEIPEGEEYLNALKRGTGEEVTYKMCGSCCF